jgi:hypothetical protein
MNSPALKIGAILIFVAGVVTFVAYRSGYFDTDPIDTKTEEITVDIKPDVAETPNDPLDDTTVSVKEDIPVMPATNNDDKSRPSVKIEDFNRDRMHSSKSLLLVEPEDFKMHSSKSAPIFEPSDLETPRMHGSKSGIMLRPEDIKQQERMSSSKSLIFVKPKDINPIPMLIQPKDSYINPAPNSNKKLEPNSNESINNPPGQQMMGGSKPIQLFNINDPKPKDTTDRLK